MYNGKPIILGLAVFLGLALLPFILGAGKPELKVETEKPKNVKECIMKTEKIRDVHMVLLNEWRDDVIRNGKRVYTAENGKQYNMSLTNTCMGCHENKDKFCDKCHNEVGVVPYCWTCHNISPVKKEGGK